MKKIFKEKENRKELVWKLDELIRQELEKELSFEKRRNRLSKVGHP